MALKKKTLVPYINFWKQQYFNQNGSGLVVKDVKCYHMVLGLNLWKTFF